MYNSLKPKVILFFVFVLSCNSIFAQVNTDTGKDHIPFFDNFNKNRNGWPVQSGENYNFSFIDRKYDMNSSREGMIQPVVNTPFDHKRDYIIVCTLNHVSGLSESGYGLSFSYKRDGNTYQFQLASKGYYRVVRYLGNAIIQVIPWTESDKVIKEDGQSNQLKIWKKGTVCELYINDSLVNSFENFENEGDYTGFILENKQHVVATLLTIEYQ